MSGFRYGYDEEERVEGCRAEERAGEDKEETGKGIMIYEHTHSSTNVASGLSSQACLFVSFKRICTTNKCILLLLVTAHKIPWITRWKETLER